SRCTQLHCVSSSCFSVAPFLFLSTAGPRLLPSFPTRRSSDLALPKQLEQYARATDPLSPSKAAFYSAVLPGLGQYYNKSYWKIPVVYGGMATSLYFYIDNSKIYNRARNEYKLRLRGVEKTDNPKVGSYTQAQLISVQKSAQRNKDLSLFITIGIYVLNIIDANVDAHLQQFNVDEDLSFKPTF